MKTFFKIYGGLYFFKKSVLSVLCVLLKNNLLFILDIKIILLLLLYSYNKKTLYKRDNETSVGVGGFIPFNV